MPTAVSNHSQVIQGVQIHWRQHGSPTDLTPVVMFHGLNDSSLTWDHIAQDIAKDRLVLVPDFPGHGLSDRPDASYELDWYAELMASWISALSLNEFDLIGHSFGGGVAQTMMLTCRDRIRRLVLVSSGGLGREVNILLRIASVPFVVEKLGQPFMKLSTRILLRLARDGRSPEDIDELSAHNDKEGSARAFSRTVRSVIDWRGQRRSYEAQIRNVSSLPPILLLWGAHDPIIPLSHASSFLKTIANVKAYVFYSSGHYPHFQEPELFVQILKDYLDSSDLPLARCQPIAEPDAPAPRLRQGSRH